MNALSLPLALRFNARVAPEAVERFGAAIGAPEDPAAKVEELARLAGFERLRDFGVPAGELGAVAMMAAARRGNEHNPRPATAGEIEELLNTIW
jgi:alcohol dehydrogenase class IV